MLNKLLDILLELLVVLLKPEQLVKLISLLGFILLNYFGIYFAIRVAAYIVVSLESDIDIGTYAKRIALSVGILVMFTTYLWLKFVDPFIEEKKEPLAKVLENRLVSQPKK